MFLSNTECRIENKWLNSNKIECDRPQGFLAFNTTEPTEKKTAGNKTFNRRKQKIARYLFT